MNNLEKLVDNINETEKIASADYSEWDPNTRPGMQVRQRQAKDKLSALRDEYRKRLFERTAKIFVNGDRNKDKFFNLVKGEGAFIYSANDIYKVFAGYVEPQILMGGTFTSAAFLKLTEVAATYARHFGLNPQILREPSNRGVANFNDLVTVVKDTVRDAYNDNLNRAYILSSLYDNAVKERFHKDIVLLVLADFTEEEKAVLLEGILPGNPNFAVNLNDDEVPTRALMTKITNKVYETFRKLNLFLVPKDVKDVQPTEPKQQ